MFDWSDNKLKYIVILSITNIIFIGVICYLLFSKPEERIISESKIIVQIIGEVNKPDIYELEVGTRLYELIELAGGFTKNADIISVNQSRELKDEMKIIIPSILDGESKDNRININTADLSELMLLNGIGEVKAQAIITYRENHGPFTIIEEIMKVSGIGLRTFEKIKPYIYC